MKNFSMLKKLFTVDNKIVNDVFMVNLNKNSEEFNRIREERLKKWFYCTFKKMFDLSGTERGKMMCKTFSDFLHEFGIKHDLNASHKKDRKYNLSLDPEGLNIKVAVKYSKEGKDRTKKNGIVVPGGFQFDQVRKMCEYDFIFFIFIRPKIEECLFFSLRRYELNNFKMSILHTSAVDSYGLNTNAGKKTLGRTNMEVFSDYGDGTLKGAIINIFKRQIEKY